MQTIILSAFPGTGKTYFCKNVAQNFPGQNLVVKDSDSSTFDKSDFPANYMKHIKEQIGNNLFTVGKDTYVTQVVQELLTEVRANGAS